MSIFERMRVSIGRMVEIGAVGLSMIHIVATLDKVEADLELIEGCIHFGKDDVGTVVEEEEMVGIACQVNNSRIGICRAKVSAACVPAVATEGARHTFEVLGEGQRGGAALGVGRDDSRAVVGACARGLNPEFVLGAGREASESVGESGGGACRGEG